MPRQVKWKHNEILINSTNFTSSFQTPSMFCPSVKVYLSPDWIDDLCFGFALFYFANSSAFASNVLLADMNSLSCKMFMFRLSGAQVRWRWMAALIPANAHIVKCLAFLCFPFAKFQCSFFFLAPFLTRFPEQFYSPPSCSLRVFCVSFLLSLMQLLVVSVQVLTRKYWKSGTSKFPNVKLSLQKYKVSKCNSFTNILRRQLWHCNGTVRISNWASEVKQNQGGKSIFSSPISRSACKMARFTENSLSFGDCAIIIKGEGGEQ